MPVTTHLVFLLCSFAAAAAGTDQGEDRGTTDAANRLSHLLKALAKTPSQVRLSLFFSDGGSFSSLQTFLLK